MFDYVHLRAPLPRDLKGSEIFPGPTVPESYFLMVSLVLDSTLRTVLMPETAEK